MAAMAASTQTHFSDIKVENIAVVATVTTYDLPHLQRLREQMRKAAKTANAKADFYGGN